jgi:serine O-acetyltransferase
MFDNLRADYARLRVDRSRILRNGGWNRSSFLENVRITLALTTWCVISYRFSRWVFSLRVPIVRQLLSVVAVIFQRWVQLWTAVYISKEADIGPGFLVHTPYGICIGPTKIGANCTVGTGVLIAGGSRGVGDNVYFGPGAKVIADTRIGNNVVIVANSLVLSDVPDNTTIVGVPARIRLPGGQARRFEKVATPN